ncbi:MAG: hypothetical protein Q8N99_06605 [Nanoarchaeota archaeon]|nr:hypothetical protein [Nanoarchaeota archaeon]
MYIDGHVHCRDEEEKEKETIAHALLVARDSGVSAIFDIGNLGKNPVISRKRVLDRFDLALAADSPVKYFVYIILTKVKEQVREAVETWREFFPTNSNERVGVGGLKMFAGHSTGNCGIITLEEQLEVDNWLVEFGFDGVKPVHCEEESLIHPELWNAENPISHCDVRPEESEIKSVIQQINNYNRTKAKYHLEVKHVTTPEVVKIINDNKGKMRISSEVCPRNLLLDNRVMLGSNRIMYKVNPPLRSLDTRAGLLNCFLRREIDTLSTDHSPHTYEDKTVKHLSGMPGLASWPDFVEMLIERGASQELIDYTAFYRINQIYGLNISRLNLLVKRGVHLGEYVIDPFISLKTVV